MRRSIGSLCKPYGMLVHYTGKMKELLSKASDFCPFSPSQSKARKRDASYDEDGKIAQPDRQRPSIDGDARAKDDSCRIRERDDAGDASDDRIVYFKLFFMVMFCWRDIIIKSRPKREGYYRLISDLKLWSYDHCSLMPRHQGLSTALSFSIKKSKVV